MASQSAAPSGRAREIEPLMSAREVMARLGCSRSFVQDHKDELGGRKLGGLLRFRLADVEAFIARGKAETPAAAEAAAVPEPTPLRGRPALVHKGPINKLTGLPWGEYR